MTVAKDNYIDPEKKARWGFSGEPGSITVGPKTVGETGGVDHARTIPDNSGAHNNGGGSDDVAELQRRNSELQAQLDAANAQITAQNLGGQGAQINDQAVENLDELNATQIKERLDALNIEYKGNASREALLEQLKAASTPAE